MDVLYLMAMLNLELAALCLCSFPCLYALANVLAGLGVGVPICLGLFCISPETFTEWIQGSSLTGPIT